MRSVVTVAARGQWWQWQWQYLTIPLSLQNRHPSQIQWLWSNNFFVKKARNNLCQLPDYLASFWQLGLTSRYLPPRANTLHSLIWLNKEITGTLELSKPRRRSLAWVFLCTLNSASDPYSLYQDPSCLIISNYFIILRFPVNWKIPVRIMF